jgi:hypothetical protein
LGHGVEMSLGQGWSPYYPHRGLTHNERAG